VPTLLCPSPIILDQSFPRDEDQLQLVAFALGTIIESVEKNDAHLLLTETLRDFVESFDWNPPRPFALLMEIHRMLSQLYLQPSDRLIMVEVSEVEGYQRHPIPQGCVATGLIELWSDELGKILELHDRCSDDNGFFIGIACESAFAGEGPCFYPSDGEQRAFPLVGPQNLSDLEDAYVWHPTKMSFNDLRLREVSFDLVRKNVEVIGAARIEKPRGGGSHFMVTFRRGRSWPLDKNTDPLPELFLKELIPITGYPLNVIKYALIFGELPESILRLTSVAEWAYGN